MKTTTAAVLAAPVLAAAILAAPAASAAPIPPCTAHQLHLSLGHERANTGHVTWTLTALDRGPACILPAFPKLGLEGARGNALHSATTRTGKARSMLVLFGLTAQATVSYGSDGEPGAVDATWLTAGGARVRFPGGIAQVYEGQINVTAFAPGRK